MVFYGGRNGELDVDQSHLEGQSSEGGDRPIEISNEECIDALYTDCSDFIDVGIAIEDKDDDGIE